MADLLPYSDIEAFADVIIDSATLLIGGEQITLSRGGWAFDPGEEWDDYPFPGRIMNTVGTRGLVRSKPTIKGTALTTGEDQISTYRPDGTWGDHASIAGARTFTPNALRAYLTNDDYLEDVVCVWKRNRGDFIAVEFPVAICGAWNIASADGDEGQTQIIIEAVGDYTTGERPYRIRTVPTVEDITSDGPSDLPEDEECGNIIDDRNAATLGLDDDDSVTAWPDATDTYPDWAPDGTIGQAAPTFKATGFSGGSPCVQFDGVNDGLRAATQITGGTFTSYFVLDAVGNPGGDGTGVVWATNGYPRAKGFTSLGPGIVGGSGGVGAFVNTHAFFPTFENIAYSGKTGPHLWCFVFDQLLGNWQLFVDDDFSTPLVDNACPAQITEGSIEWIAYAASSNPVAMKLGRRVTYDKAHDEDCRNAVRAAMQLLWPGLP